MSQKKNSKSIGDIFNDLENYISKSPNLEEKEGLNEEISQLKKYVKGANRFLLIILLLFILTFLGCIFLLDRNDRLNFKNEALELKLQKTKFDSLVENLLEFKKKLDEDSVEVDAITYRVDSLGNPKSYWTIAREKDSLALKAKKLDIISDEHDELHKKYENLVREYNALELQNRIDSVKLELIKENLEIEFVIRKYEDYYNINFKGNKLDSLKNGIQALRQYFYYDKVKGSWKLDIDKLKNED